MTLALDPQSWYPHKLPHRNKSLNIKGAMYLGGHPHMNRTGDMTGTYKGLQGCVRDLRIRRKSIGLVEGVESVGVVSCSVHPCKEGYCRNEGQCEAREGEREPVCSCRGGFRGRRCHKVKKVRDNVRGRKNYGKKKKKNTRRVNLGEHKKKKQKGRRKRRNNKYLS